MKRKLGSPNTSPSAPEPKRHEKEAACATPSRPLPESISSQNTTAPKANRTRRKSAQSVASETSYKSLETLPYELGSLKLSGLDVGATRTGRYRDMIEIDLHLLDGQPYTAQVSEIEAYKLIYKKALNLDKSIFHGLRVKWLGHPLVWIRVKEKIDIDEFPKALEYFKTDFDSDGNKILRKVTCEIRGVQDAETKKAISEERKARNKYEADTWPITRWVKIEGTSYDIKPGFLEKCLGFFGEMQTDIECETMIFHDSESEDENSKVELVTGNMSVKMKLELEIPQFVPLYGQKVKIHYRGIVKTCTKCFQQGHISRECSNKKVLLIDYVEAFMDQFPTFPKELYGRWSKLVEVNKEAKKTTQTRQPTPQPSGSGRAQQRK